MLNLSKYHLIKKSSKNNLYKKTLKIKSINNKYSSNNKNNTIFNNILLTQIMFNPKSNFHKKEILNIIEKFNKLKAIKKKKKIKTLITDKKKVLVNISTKQKLKKYFLIDDLDVNLFIENFNNNFYNIIKKRKKLSKVKKKNILSLLKIITKNPIKKNNNKLLKKYKKSLIKLKKKIINLSTNYIGMFNKSKLKKRNNKFIYNLEYLKEQYIQTEIEYVVNNIKLYLEDDKIPLVNNNELKEKIILAPTNNSSEIKNIKDYDEKMRFEKVKSILNLPDPRYKSTSKPFK
jgi:hypothetical protein